MQVFALEDDLDHVTVAIFATKEEAKKVASQFMYYKIRSFTLDKLPDWLVEDMKDEAGLSDDELEQSRQSFR